MTFKKLFIFGMTTSLLAVGSYANGPADHNAKSMNDRTTMESEQNAQTGPNTVGESGYILDYDYYDTYDYGYDDTTATDDRWFYDHYTYSTGGDVFSDPEYTYDYDWIENEYEWQEDDLIFDDDLDNE
ncbi:MAG: hypothetical protein CME62_12180 [Halobacteriovoraceae bacterium]|nr:hypothetical protein [Halobacteriovoraceae bacterium]|tara:strand:+ start:2463 stop:2846 length:384 start_codon:yes stop_codon:yes gene_type:complete